MGMLEVMYQVKDYADYFVSSQNEEALDGWPYDKLIKPIIDNQEIDSMQLASDIVDSYIDSVKSSPTKMSNVLTLSVTDLNLIDELAEGINTLSSLLLKLHSEKPLKLVFAEKVTNKILISAHIADRYVPYSVFFDLNDFLENIKISMMKNKTISGLAKQLLELLSRIVIKEKHQTLKGQYNLGIGGISLYFTGMDTKSYKDNKFSIDTSWDELIAARTSYNQMINK